MDEYIWSPTGYRPQAPVKELPCSSRAHFTACYGSESNLQPKFKVGDKVQTATGLVGVIIGEDDFATDKYKAYRVRFLNHIDWYQETFLQTCQS